MEAEGEENLYQFQKKYKKGKKKHRKSIISRKSINKMA